jgi:hypothetical protein
MSMMTSARGLSLARSIRSMTAMICAGARTVSVFAVLFGSTAGCTGIPGVRMIKLISCVISFTSACDR